MSTLNKSKLKYVLDTVPPGHLVTASWLTGQGIAYATFRDYVKRGWLERVARGVFRRPAPGQSGSTRPIDWRTCVLSLQHILGCRVHVGARTALALRGHGHYLPLAEDHAVWLYGDDIPSWLSRVRLNAHLTTRTLTLFAAPALGLSRHDEAQASNLAKETAGHWTLTVSSPERAVLESIDELPDHESFDNVDRSFESLANLRPNLLVELLANCRRIKTKRLFFVFADRHDHAWRKYVDPEQFDLGRGDRALVPGGSIHPRYRIVIPDAYLPSRQDD